METNEEIVRRYLKNELKRKLLSTEERKALNDALLYMTNKQKKQNEEWQTFLERVEEKKKTWDTIHPIDGLVLEYRMYESEGRMMSFGMSALVERHSSWLFEVEVMMHSNRRILFNSIHEKLDEVEVDSFEALEDIIETFLASGEFKQQLEEIKKHSI